MDRADQVYNRATDPTRRERRGVSVCSVIAAAKADVQVEELAERVTGLGEKRGREVAFLCPLHDDHNPSLRVNPEKGVWYCDPCGVGGDVVRLAQLAWGYPDDGRGAAEAAAFLLLEFGYEVPQRPPAWFRRQERQAAMRAVIKDARVEVLMRRLWRWIFVPILADIEDADERARAGEKLWATILPLAMRLIDNREGAA